MTRTSIETGTGNEPLFQVRVETRVARTPDEVFAVVSDLGRSGEWSAECRGGEWVEGRPAEVGAVFRGENYRALDVVAWAPVVRGTWTTHAEVVASEPGRTFGWAMRNKAGRAQESVWGFDITPAEGGSVLVHHFRMGRPTEGILDIVKDMDDTERARFFEEWGAKLEKDMTATIGRIRDVIEKG